MSPFDAPPQHLTQRLVRISSPAPEAGSSLTSAPREPRTFTVRVDQPAADWLRDAMERIEGLTALAADWDSYGARPVSAEAAMAAANFLLKAAYPELPPPTIVPVSDGGLQVEWHRGGLNVEIAFSDEVEESGVYIEDRDRGETLERPIADAAAELVKVASRLTP